jgi:hypothetical protein
VPSVSYLMSRNDRLRSREVTVGFAHFKFSWARANHSLDMALVPAKHVWYLSRSEGCNVGVERVCLNIASQLKWVERLTIPGAVGTRRGRD